MSELHRLFPHVHGLQDVSLGECVDDKGRTHYTNVEVAQAAMQVHFQRNPAHWVWSAKFGHDVFVGSTSRGPIPTLIGQQLLDLYAAAGEDTLSCNQVTIQQQRDSLSCGVICIAYLYQLALTLDVSTVSWWRYKTTELWKWFKHCAEHGSLVPPPLSTLPQEDAPGCMYAVVEVAAVGPAVLEEAAAGPGEVMRVRKPLRRSSDAVQSEPNVTSASCAGD